MELFFLGVTAGIVLGAVSTPILWPLYLKTMQFERQLRAYDAITRRITTLNLSREASDEAWRN